MRLLRWAVLLVAALVVIVFAVANRQDVMLSLDPLPIVLVAPLYLLGLGFIALGMLIGGLAATNKSWRWRRRARQAERDAARLKGALKAERERAGALSRKSSPPKVSNAA